LKRIERSEPQQKEFCQFVGVEKAEGDRRLTFTITSAAVDRSRDVIAADGWDFTNWKKNPVVLWAHDQRQPPVGRGVKVWREGEVHKATVEFTPAELYPFGYSIFQMCEQGFLQACSVGFNPTTWNWTEDKDRPYGIDFKEQELLEFSIVPVPANPDALISAKAAGIETGLVEEWARKWTSAAARPIQKSHRFMPEIGRRCSFSR
jgi:HK97 family phage prohead protease